MLVPWKYLVASLDLLILSMLSFVKTVKITPLSFSRMNWLLFLYTCKAVATRSEIILHGGMRNKYQSGEAFDSENFSRLLVLEAAFYFKLTNTTSRKNKL